MPAAPLLSICIPTYNRAPFLRVCLDSITSQLRDLEVSDKVEVVISDNASTDDTFSVVTTFQAKSGNISYFKNTTNLGFDRNLLNVVDRARGVYCLTLGDDDALFEGTLKLLVGKLADQETPYMQVNCWGYDHELESPARPHPNRDIKEDQQFASLADFVHSIESYSDLVGIFGGMSAQLFKREQWSEFPNKEQFLGSNAIHLFILLSAFKDHSFKLLSPPVVKTRADNIRWDTYPGLETHLGRTNATLKTAMWISDLYNLGLKEVRVKRALMRKMMVGALKDNVKLALRTFGLRK